MRALPPGARVLILCALSGAALCAAPALTAAGTPWPAVAVLAALYLCVELVRACRAFDARVPQGLGAFLPVVLAAVFLLPPAAAALVAVPGALAGRVEQRPAGVRRGWHAAQQALAAWAAGHTYAVLRGPAALGGADPGQGPHFPYVLLPAAVAAAAFCLVLTALDGLVLAAAERRPVRAAWRGLVFRALVPFWVHGLAGLMMAVLWHSPYGAPAALLVLLPMYISCWVFAQYQQERAAHQATIRALVQAVDIKDRYTRGHSERVGQASAMIARELGMPEERLEVVRFAGILHDVGKLGVPTRLLRKDGPLTADERRVIELHPEYGHEMVRGIGFLGEARAAILHHHERVDGSGYPYGLTGDQIPELARVVAVADAFDAMTSTRCYSRARPVATAVAELRRCAGAHFDPAMVGALVRAVEREGWNPAVTSDEDTVSVAAPRAADGPRPADGPRAGDGPRAAEGPVAADGPVAGPGTATTPGGLVPGQGGSGAGARAAGAPRRRPGEGR
ncbi:HD-GYP domain-containing protein [Streptomyces sp. NRRL S-87]|uniref:HD-GYP domain-containing protein n=1 Tax=Streptomyces sp. NRRL S-87 TaxID=1463920 RepID=UPI00099E030B|nr:HD-GYP domain-containing protein [Streptomyces sp. NRRL S-87]